MESIKEKVERVIAEEFPGAAVELEYYPLNEKWGGNVTWQGFSRKTHLQRQRLLRETLVRRLAPQELRRLTAVFASTPAETKARLAYS